MLTSVITIKVKAGQEEAFETLVRGLVADVGANEPGALFYRAFRSPEPGKYIFLECFADKEALEAHRVAPHFVAARPQLTSFFDGAPEIVRLSAI